MSDNNVATIKETALRGKLVEIQNNEALNDSQFTVKLGITRQLWQSIKLQKRPIGLTLLRAIARTYPEINEEILAFLRDGDGHHTDEGHK